jgi:hypothetical protein
VSSSTRSDPDATASGQLGICDRIYALSASRITGEIDRADATQERLMQFMTQATTEQDQPA